MGIEDNQRERPIESRGIDARLREAIRQRPDKMTSQLAREFDILEVDVIRALPADRVTELDVSRWEALIRRLEEVGAVRVLVSNGAATMESAGRFGGFSTTGEYFNVQTTSLDLHLRWAELGAVFAVQKPGHVDGRMTYSLQFFDRAGCSALKVFISFGERIPAERQQLFEELRQQFRVAATEKS